MYELCPLCLKKGVTSRIKAIQINLEEAMWKCENEECLWPFVGADKPTFFRRIVGEKWSWEWEDYKIITEHVGSIPISTELSLYTPPVTPSVDASAKESAQLKIVKNTLESNGNIDSFLRNSSFSDSYAPRPAETAFSSQEKVSTIKESNSAKLVSTQYEESSKIAGKLLSSLPSIFDIDGDKYTDKINVKLHPVSTDTDSTDLLKRDIAVLDEEISSPAVDCNATVLATSPKSRTEKSLEIEEETIGIIESSDSSSKKLPQVRSIARTNIDLQKVDPVNIAKVVKPEKLKRLKGPATSTKEKSHGNIDGKLLNLNQHTTTITVDGIPPITLSYDLADLTIQTNNRLPVTSTPRAGRPTVPSATSTPRTELQRPECPPVLSDNNRDKELSADMPKRKLRRLTKGGRACNDGKAFEKFSFSALKKVGKSSITTNALSVVKSESPKLEEIVNRNQSCAFEGDCHFPANAIDVPIPTAAAVSTGARDLSQRYEPLNSVNLAGNNSSATESSTVDNVNFSNLIDDVLLDCYQNTTQDLNEDWFDSFLNEIT